MAGNNKVSYSVTESLMCDILRTLRDIQEPLVVYDTNRQEMADKAILEMQSKARNLEFKINETFNLNSY